MANVNVNRSNPDQFYRYKMPRIIAKVEGKGNGIKTVIVNMPEVAKALARPPAYPTKYFGCELGAQTQLDAKHDRFIVNGSHDANKLQDLLDGFIKRFVLCPECDNPETNLHVQEKKGLIKQQCIACGYQGMVDMRHKLTTYILKNPPEVEPGNAGTTPSKKEKKNKKSKKGSETEENGQNGVDGHSKQKDADSYDDDDDDWGDDTSDAAVKQRMEALTDAAKNMTFTDDLEKTQQQRVDLFYNFVKEKKEDESIGKAYKEILAEAERLEIKDKATLVLMELLCDDKIVQQIAQYKIHFRMFTNQNIKAQKNLLGGFEQVVQQHKESLIPKVAHILKAFYDADILDEEVILEWDKKVSKKYVSKEVSQEIHAKAAPLIKWLKEAEEEEESESEDEVEVVYSHTEKVGVTTVVDEKKSPKEEDDDDLDIDDI